MQNLKLQGRGLYNLLRLTWELDPKVEVEAWQVADYRLWTPEQLLEALSKLRVLVDEKAFRLYAQSVDSPEELTDCLWVDDKNFKEREKAYLLIFELWRRWLPEKSSISIFCDELDHLIDQYDKGDLYDADPLLSHLCELENILDGHVDQGSGMDEVFSAVCDYCAHELESFLYDFISDLILSHEEMTASELIDGFYEYIKDKRFFDLLRAELLLPIDSEEATLMLQRIFEMLREKPEIPLLLDLLQVAKHSGDLSLPLDVFKTLIECAQSDEESQNVFEQFQEFLKIIGKENLLEEKKVKSKTLLKKLLLPILNNL